MSDTTVTIDYENREETDRLHDAVFQMGRWSTGETVNRDGLGYDDTQAALREFANPTPPPLAEPTDLAARVLDAKGREWAQSRDGGFWWAFGCNFDGYKWHVLTEDFGPLTLKAES